MRTVQLSIAALLTIPVAAMAQGGGGGGSAAGPTQSRDGLATASQGGQATNNSMPAGGVNAATGPQSQPAYPSGSTTANPGAAFVKTQPVPATGPVASPPGTITTTIGSDGAAKTGGPGVGQAATPAK